MNVVVEGSIRDLRMNVNAVNQLGLDLHRNYFDNPSEEERKWGLEWQEAIHQQSRELLFACTERFCGYEEIKAGIDAIGKTIPLLSGSVYEGFQRGRIEDLRNYASFLGVTI